MSIENSSKSQKSYYRSDQDVRWCSGCGDYYVLNALSSAWAQCGIPKENIALISGIGCSSRLPYYCSTYGFHTIHGRAPSVALGLKITRPELSVWVITGDGDGLSIGANHLVHLCRRNPDITVLLFNNEIYGLTKGQHSPTSRLGLTTRSTPKGTLEEPLEALPLAITSGATFVARVVDTDLALMRQVFQQAHEHKGVSFIEIYTNCVIFNDGAFHKMEKRSQRLEHTISLEEGKPLIFGTHKNKALIWKNFTPQTISLPTKEKLIEHEPSREDPLYAYALSRYHLPHNPLALGVLRKVSKPTYEEQIQNHKSQAQTKSFSELLAEGSFQKTTKDSI